jgi:hypothetical protein
VNVGVRRCSSRKCERAPGRGLSTDQILRCVVCSLDSTQSIFHEVSLLSCQPPLSSAGMNLNASAQPWSRVSNPSDAVEVGNT